MHKLHLAAALALVLAGCNVNLNPNVATPSQVVIAANAFDAAEATATNYLNLPLCGTGLCRTAALSASIVKAVRTGRAARIALEADINTSVPAPISTYQALAAAVTTLQALNVQQ